MEAREKTIVFNISIKYILSVSQINDKPVGDWFAR